MPAPPVDISGGRIPDAASFKKPLFSRLRRAVDKYACHCGVTKGA
jgi:hypothetical protein